MKFFIFTSIRTRMMTAIALLIVALIGTIVWLWARNERLLNRQQKWHEAKSVALLLADAWGNELYDGNISQIRLGLERLIIENQDFVYILVTDARSENQIVVSLPSQFQEQYIPDVVPLEVTNRALELTCLSSKRCAPNVSDTFVLRDIQFSNGDIRARRGERILEAAAAISNSGGKKLGVFRVGISLRASDRAVAIAIRKALAVGVLGLVVGSIVAYLLARRLSEPIQRLQVSAAKIAAGDWHHRAEIDQTDEIGALATSFNEMSAKLQFSFNKLQRTLEAFERFVPNKFIATIAPEGIENVQVGVASAKVITILFCDIRGYTSISEQLTSQETFYFLNDYLECMGKVVDEAGGFIDKYIGDAIMALFDEEATDSAVQAAINMQNALEEFNSKRLSQGKPRIAAGIGIHRGEVMMGTVGFTSRIESTVIGDAVNLASRIEGITKNFGCNILITEATVKALRSPEKFILELINASVKVKGKEEAIAVYAVKD